MQKPYRTPLICILLILFPSVLHAQQLFTINTADKPPYSNEDNTGVYDKIILQVFEKIGVNVKINHLLSARSIENVEVGIDDAEYARIKGLSENYKNIRIVDEKLIDFAFTAFSKDNSILIDGWDSLANYDVAFMTGWKIYETNVKKAKSILMVPSENELFKVIEKGRVEIILYELLRGFDYMKKNNIVGISSLKNPLSTRGMYLYINKKHQKLIPDIEKALKEFKKSHEYMKIITSAER